MPLRDHYHEPLRSLRPPQMLHSRWAAALSDALNEGLLPAGYFAGPLVTRGGVEIDLATLHESAEPNGSGGAGGGGTATLPATWTAPHFTMQLPLTAREEVGVRIYEDVGGLQLVGAMELVSPRNKDRPAARQAFVAKCCSLLTAGIGLVVVDIVTERRANLHAELCATFERPEPTGLPPEADLYAVGYRPSHSEGESFVGVWPHALAVGQPMPTVPLALFRGPVLPIDLEATYTEACRRLRLT